VNPEFLNLAEVLEIHRDHIVQNHPFVDGNKRTGAVAALVFLTLNDIEIDADEDSFERMVLDVASGQVDKPAVAEFFRRHAH
jgi:death on curing protein